MTSDEERRILEQVAAGELGPEDAAARLAALAGQSHSHDGGAEAEDAPEPHTVEPAEGDQARRVRVNAIAGSVHVIADATVAEASAEGDYVMYRDGDVLVVETQLGADDEDDDDDDRDPYGERFHRPGRRSGFVIDLGPGFRRFGMGRTARLHHRRRLLVRVNPELPLDVSVSAGSLLLRGSRAPLHCDVAAGSARLDDVRGPLECTVSAGSLSVRALIDGGESHVSCDAGSVKIDLLPGSSVDVSLAATLGKAAILTGGGRPEAVTGLGLGDERRVTVGAGAGRLDVRANLGKILLTTPD